MKRFLSLIVSALCAVCAWAQGTMTGADLAAMMGSAVYEGDLMGGIQKVYAREDGNIYQQWGLQAESVIVEASAQVTLYGSTYECPANFTFHIEDGKVSKVSIWGFDLIPSLGDFTEAEFAEFVGGDVYSGTDGVTIIAKNGAIYMVDGEGTETALHDNFDKFERVGKDFKFSKDGDINTFIIFHPLGDKFVVYYQEDYVNKLEHIYVVSADEAELVAAMGDREYVKPGDPWAMLHVENDKVCLVSTAPEGTKSETLNERYMLTKKDNNTFVFFYGSTEYDFHITDGKVTTVTYMVDDEVRALYQMPLTAPIAQIGETIYTDVDAFITAFEEIEGNATVKLLGDITLPLNRNITNDKALSDISLDLNGHSIKANASHVGVIEVKGFFSVTGEGLIENDTDGGAAFGAYDGGVAEVNGGSYLCGAAICYCTFGSEVTINNGKFKVSSMYFDGFDWPTVNGGLFSIDPSDCYHSDSVAIPNDDEETKAEYPYKVVDNQAGCNYFASLMGDYIYYGNGVKFFVSEGQLMMTIGENQPEPLASIMNYFSKEENDGYLCSMTGDDYVFYIENGELAQIGVKPGSQVIFYLDKRSTVSLAQIAIGENVTDYYNAEEFCLELASIEGTVTVKLLSDMTFSGYDNICNWQETANVTLDLNGHNIKGNVDGCLVGSRDCKFTIVGEGTVENIAEDSYAIHSEGYIVVNSGTYKSTFAICYVYVGCELIINGGKFNAPALYDTSDPERYIKPIVKGGLFSMNPTDCVAEGYEVVANDDEVYKYKVVAKGATAIESINTDKAQKAVKTIENGKVVIIRGEKKYDLSGREL